MKELTITLCLFLSINALAQSSDTVRKDTSRILAGPDMRSINPHMKYLSVIDDKIYYRSSIKKGIDPSSIIDVEVLKSKEGVNKYGKLAKNGVVVIITRKFAIK